MGSIFALQVANSGIIIESFVSQERIEFRNKKFCVELCSLLTRIRKFRIMSVILEEGYAGGIRWSKHIRKRTGRSRWMCWS